MKRTFRAICSFLIFGALAAVGASAQNITSTLVGQVTDPSGDGVPAAHLTVSNSATGISTTGVSSPTGSYSIGGLQPGTYSVSASATGFSTFKTSGIVVTSAQVIRVNIALKLGSLSQTVHVSGAAPLITTDSPTIGVTLDTHQIRALPSSVQSVGGLLATVPGAVIGVALSAPLFSGATHWGSTNFTLNGVSMDDVTNGGGAYAYTSGDPGTMLINQPPLDTLQEFQVVDVNENAEFRSQATVLMVTKAGTNQFHGDVYEFFKNKVLNANGYLNNARGQKRPQNNLNQFGGTIGGPVLKNRAFFFFAPVYYRSISSGLAQRYFPSTAMTKGDFSALLGEGTQLYNPLTGQPFVGNQIPTSMIAPQAQALLKYVQAPTVPDANGLPNGGLNFFQTVPIRSSMNSYTFRGDYKIGSHDGLFAVYTHAGTPEWNVFRGQPLAFGNAANFGFQDRSINAGETHTFNATTLNEFRAAWFKHTSNREGVNDDINPASFFPQLTPGNNRGLPTMGASGYSTLTTDYGAGPGHRNSVYSMEFSDNFTKVLHNHTIKAGFDETGYKNAVYAGEGSLGSFSFSGVWTGNKGWPGQPQSQGNAFADFLLGDTNSASRSEPAPNDGMRNRITSGYVQDTWQATPHLTLNYGIRYMYQAPWGVENNRQSYWDQKNNKIALPQNSAAPTLPVGGNPNFFKAYLPFFETTQSIGLPTQFMKPSKSNWAPRFGFAYRPFANTVIRGGYGVYYSYLIGDFGYWGFLNLPFGTNTQTSSSDLPGKPTAPYLPDLTFANPFGNAEVNLSAHPTLYSAQRDLKNTRVQQYSLTVERQFGRNWAGRASYVGSVTRNIPWFEMDVNQPLAQIPNTPYQNQRPYQPWGEINSVRDGGLQNFSQLQLGATRRFANGISFQAQYSWTKSLDDANFVGGPQQVAFPELDYGNSSSFRTNTLVFNYVYALPFGHGKRFLHDSNGFVNALAGGWQISGITTYATGLPFSVGFAVPPGFIGWSGGRASRVPGVPVYLPHSGHDVVKGIPYFNPKAFGPPEPWTWGTSGRNSLWGPGMSNWDMSAMKHFTLPGERVHLTVRADFFNAFNHFNLGNPNATVASPQYGGLPIKTAGEITGGSGNRTIQLGTRLSF